MGNLYTGFLVVKGLKKWYETYPIGEHGVSPNNHAKAKMLLAGELSQERKPSAYKQICSFLLAYRNILHNVKSVGKSWQVVL